MTLSDIVNRLKCRHSCLVKWFSFLPHNTTNSNGSSKNSNNSNNNNNSNNSNNSNNNNNNDDDDDHDDDDDDDDNNNNNNNNEQTKPYPNDVICNIRPKHAGYHQPEERDEYKAWHQGTTLPKTSVPSPLKMGPRAPNRKRMEVGRLGSLLQVYPVGIPVAALRFHYCNSKPGGSALFQSGCFQGQARFMVQSEISFALHPFHM